MAQTGSPSGSCENFDKPLEAPRGARKEPFPVPVASSPKSSTPEPPSRPPPQKAGGFARGGALNINPLRALSPMVQLIRRTTAASPQTVPQTPRGPISSASDSQLPSVKPGPPPTPPRAGSKRPTPRKPATPQREGSPQLPMVSTPTPPPQETGKSPKTSRSSSKEEYAASPVPHRPKTIKPPAAAVTSSAPAAPGHPPGGAHSAASDKYSTQCREMLQVQSHANKLLSIVFNFTVTEEAAVSILDQYPELAWLAHCLQRCPMPPCWTSVDGEQDEARYVDMESGDMTDTPPLMKQFADMATLMLQWRQSPTSAGDVGKELGTMHASAVEDAARARRVWTGPHVDGDTGAKFWHCEATGRSTWGDPSAAAEFLARVAERLKRALPVPLESEPDSTSEKPAGSEAAPAKKVSESVVAIAEAAAAAEARSAPEKSTRSAEAPDAAVTPAPVDDAAAAENPALADTPAEADQAGDADTGAQSNKLGGTGELIRSRSEEVRQMMAKISRGSKVKEVKDDTAPKRKNSPKPRAPSPSAGQQDDAIVKPRAPSSSPTPRAPSSSPTPRAPSPCTGHPRPSPGRTPRRGVAQLVAQEATNNSFGGIGNKVYLEAAAEVRGPKAGVWRPGASRPSVSARRRPEKTETLEPLDSSRSASQPAASQPATSQPAASQPKHVTFLEKDGVTAVRPGRDTPEGASSPDMLNDNMEAPPSARPPSARRVSTPSRPKTRRGDDVERPWTPAASTDLADEVKPEPVRPGSALGGTAGRPGSALGGTHGGDRPGSARGGTLSRERPGSALGGTLGRERPGSALGGTLGRGRPGSALGGTRGRERLVLEDAVRTASPGRLQPGASLGATADEFMKDTDSEAECVEMAADSPLGNTGCARHLCDIAIAAAVDAATAATNDEFGETQQFLDTQPLSPMRSMRMSKVLGAEVMAFDAADDEAEAVAKAESVESPIESPIALQAPKVESSVESPVASPVASPVEVAPVGAEPVTSPIKAAPAEAESSPVASPIKTAPAEDDSEVEAPPEARTQGAWTVKPPAADPPVEVSAHDPMGDVLTNQATEALNNTQLSATLISIAGPCSPSPKKEGESFLGDSPSLVILEDPRFTPCKVLPRPTSPQRHASPQTPKRAPRSGRRSSRGRARSEERPIRCRSPEPLSARGRERLESERRELFQPCWHNSQACWRNAQAVADDTAAQANAAAPLNAPRGPRPTARGVRHVARGGA